METKMFTNNKINGGYIFLGGDYTMVYVHKLKYSFGDMIMALKEGWMKIICISLFGPSVFKKQNMIKKPAQAGH
jgi:hypothetical protein